MSLPEKKRLLLRIENISTIPYSLRKIKTKREELYSVLNPEISSLSPSAKSKGARLTSDSTDKNQNGKTNNINNSLVSQIKLLNPKTSLNRIKEKIISYLTLWAEARKPPKYLNFELEITPDNMTLKTPKPTKLSRKRAE